MGIKDFINTIAPAPEVLKLIRAESKRKGVNKLTTRQINAEVRSLRRTKRKRPCLDRKSSLIRTS